MSETDESYFMVNLKASLWFTQRIKVWLVNMTQLACADISHNHKGPQISFFIDDHS